MSDSRGGKIVSVKETATEFEARFLATYLTEEGIQAEAVSSGLAAFSGLGRWSVVVRQSELARAVASLAERRDVDDFEGDGPTACTDCGYSLAGLPNGGRCPECGTDLSEANTRLPAGEDQATVPVQASGGTRQWVLASALICCTAVFFVVQPWYDLISFEDWRLMPGAVAVAACVLVVRRASARRNAVR